MAKNAVYACRSCGAVHERVALRRGAWGDMCCPACGVADLERQRSRFERWYAIFFLYKVY